MKEARFRYYKGRLSSQFLVPDLKEQKGIRHGSIRLEPRFYLEQAEEINEADYLSAIAAAKFPYVLQKGEMLVEIAQDGKDPFAELVSEIYAEYSEGLPGEGSGGRDFLANKDNLFHGKITGSGWCRILELSPEEKEQRIRKIIGNNATGCLTPFLPNQSLPGLSGCSPLSLFSGAGCLKGGCMQLGCGLLSLLALLSALLWVFRSCTENNSQTQEKNQNIRVIHDTVYVKEENQIKEFSDSTLITKTEAIELPNVQFYTNSARLLPYSIRSIQELAEYLRSHPNVNAIIKGYTDDVGDDDANLRLSQSRAESVRSMLIAFGIEQERVTAIGYGETRPKVRGNTTEARALNRRVEVELVNLVSEETKKSQKTKENK